MSFQQQITRLCSLGFISTNSFYISANIYGNTNISLLRKYWWIISTWQHIGGTVFDALLPHQAHKDLEVSQQNECDFFNHTSLVKFMTQHSHKALGSISINLQTHIPVLAPSLILRTVPVQPTHYLDCVSYLQYFSAHFSLCVHLIHLSGVQLTPLRLMSYPHLWLSETKSDSLLPLGFLKRMESWER